MERLQPDRTTFLFSDIEGSTRLLQDLGSEYGWVVTRQRQIVRRAIREFNGEEQGTEGDSFYVVFPDPYQAVSAAIKVQRTMASEKWPANSRVRLRMGIHTGKRLLSHGVLIGLDVHQASRIASAAHGGQVLLSESCKSLLEGDFPLNASAKDLGEYVLRDFEGPRRLFQLCIESLPDDFPPLRTPSRSRLPELITSFVGREQDVNDIRGLLESSRLVTLSGCGGIGKTRLAVEAAKTCRQMFEDMYYVTMDQVENADRVLYFLFQEVEASGATREKSHPETLEDFEMFAFLRERLETRSTLLVLDGFEKVAAAAPLISDLLAAVPTLRALVTSQSLLRVSGEARYLVQPLRTPDDPEDQSMESLASLDSVNLFLVRAAAVVPDLTLTERNASSIARICSRLDGIPLALELAAARMRSLSVSEIAASLDDRLRFLVGGPKDAAARHRTMRAAIDWSHDLLTDSQQQLLHRISVFAGSWTLDAAEAVCNINDELGFETLEGLESLIDQSFVTTRTTSFGTTRYYILDILREYAAEQLRMKEESSEIASRFESFYQPLFETNVLAVSKDDPVDWKDRVTLERENLIKVLGSRDVGEVDPCSLAAAVLQYKWTWIARLEGDAGAAMMDATDAEMDATEAAMDAMDAMDAGMDRPDASMSADASSAKTRAASLWERTYDFAAANREWDEMIYARKMWSTCVDDSRKKEAAADLFKLAPLGDDPEETIRSAHMILARVAENERNWAGVLRHSYFGLAADDDFDMLAVWVDLTSVFRASWMRGDVTRAIILAGALETFPEKLTREQRADTLWDAFFPVGPVRSDSLPHRCKLCYQVSVTELEAAQSTFSDGWLRGVRMTLTETIAFAQEIGRRVDQRRDAYLKMPIKNDFLRLGGVCPPECLRRYFKEYRGIDHTREQWRYTP
jgi:predicted ATPase/class 3 adenylate cyclase